MKLTATIFGILLLLPAVSLVGISCKGKSPAASERMVGIGTHRLQMCVEGKGTPTVVIEAGITDRMENWRPRN